MYTKNCLFVTNYCVSCNSCLPSSSSQSLNRANVQAIIIDITVASAVQHHTSKNKRNSGGSLCKAGKSASDLCVKREILARGVGPWFARGTMAAFVGGRAHACVLFELPKKRPHIAEAHLLIHAFHTRITVSQQFLCPLNPQEGDELDWTHAHVELKEPTKVILAQVRLIGKVLEGNDLCKVFFDILERSEYKSRLLAAHRSDSQWPSLWSPCTGVLGSGDLSSAGAL